MTEKSILDDIEIRREMLLAPDINQDHPIPWFMRYDYKNDARYMAMPVSAQMNADRFMRDGYIVFENALPAEICEKTVREFKDFTSRNSDYFDKFRNENGYLERVINLHLAVPSFIDLFCATKEVLEFQDYLFGSPTSIYTSLYFEKGSSQSIHRDTPYFTTRPEYCYFGTWFALEDADVENGCLEVMPGGHLIPELDRRAFARDFLGDGEVGSINAALFDEYQNAIFVDCKTKGLEKAHVPMRRGDVLVWHPQLPHGGGEIAVPSRSRHSIVMHTVPENCPVHHAYAFFDPSLELPASAPWPSENYSGRQFAAHDTIEVMHREPRSPRSFI